MSGNPNKLSLFWQELKRRKVTRTITVYAAAAFVIVELTDIVAPSLGLPSWTLNLIIFLLSVGFIIAVILSWIYDIHPEDGIVKTEPAHKVKREDILKSSGSWKIASYISFVVIVGLIVLNIIPRTGRSDKREILDKSIAVLPFINDSPDEDNTYFINGIMEEILLNLQAIKEFQVPGRTSVEQYRNSIRSVPELSKELDVNYIVEGSGQRYGNTIRLRVQLLEATKGRHLWGESYEQEIESPEDIFEIQSKIARSIAQELKAIITPHEDEVIDRSLTSSLSAYDFFLRGREEHIHYRLDQNNTAALERAEQLYYSALEYDDTYAQAYAGLAMTYWDKHYWETFFTENFLDSVLIFADMALSHNDKLAEAYSLKGDYFRENGNFRKALQEYETALSINPNYWQAYAGAGGLYIDYQRDLVKGLENQHMAVKLNHDQELPSLLRSLAIIYFASGFQEKSKYYFEESIKLDGDSMLYLIYLGWIEIYLNDNYVQAIELLKQAYKIDSANVLMLEELGFAYEQNDQFDKAVEYYQKWMVKLDSLNMIKHNMMHRVGYCYWHIGEKEKSEYYFDMQKSYADESIKLKRTYGMNGMAHYDLAGIFAFRKEKEKAIEALGIFNDLTGERMMYWLIWFIRNDPLFEGIRDEPGYQNILSDAETKFQVEHERVRQWLEDNNLL